MSAQHDLDLKLDLRGLRQLGPNLYGTPSGMRAFAETVLGRRLVDDELRDVWGAAWDAPTGARDAEQAP